jgi:DegV family protein with EDD domain
MTVAVVTDSTAALPAELIARYSIGVVPLRLNVGSRSVFDGEVSGADIAMALRERVAVSTSRPSPAEFAAVYQRLLDGGASQIVSVHLASALSGTWEAAVLAAQDFPHGTVRVVDSRGAGMALGYAVIAAADAATTGKDAAAVQGAATEIVDHTRTMFYVDTLEHLRRGGRISNAQALLGTSLAVKPLLQMVEGRVVPLEKVRTSSKALARLVQLTAAAAGGGPVDVAVHHLDAGDRAAAVADQLRAAISQLGELRVLELSAVLGAHLGPGAIGTVVVRR